MKMVEKLGLAVARQPANLENLRHEMWRAMDVLPHPAADAVSAGGKGYWHPMATHRFDPKEHTPETLELRNRGWDLFDKYIEERDAFRTAKIAASNPAIDGESELKICRAILADNLRDSHAWQAKVHAHDPDGYPNPPEEIYDAHAGVSAIEEAIDSVLERHKLKSRSQQQASLPQR